MWPAYCCLYCQYLSVVSHIGVVVIQHFPSLYFPVKINHFPSFISSILCWNLGTEMQPLLPSRFEELPWVWSKGRVDNKYTSSRRDTALETGNIIQYLWWLISLCWNPITIETHQLHGCFFLAEPAVRMLKTLIKVSTHRRANSHAADGGCRKGRAFWHGLSSSVAW